MSRFFTALALSLAALTAPALADDVQVDFQFADETTPLPAWVDASQVVTIATEERGQLVEGHVLMADGQLLTFVSIKSHPLATHGTVARN